MPPHTHWIHRPNLNTVQMSHSDILAGSADLYIQWRLLSEVTPKNEDPSVGKRKADGLPHVAAAHILDDDLEGAEAGLADGTSSFHKVCRMLLLGCLASRLIGFGEGEMLADGECFGTK